MTWYNMILHQVKFTQNNPPLAASQKLEGSLICDIGVKMISRSFFSKVMIYLCFFLDCSLCSPNLGPFAPRVVCLVPSPLATSALADLQAIAWPGPRFPSISGLWMVNQVMGKAHSRDNYHPKKMLGMPFLGFLGDRLAAKSLNQLTGTLGCILLHSAWLNSDVWRALLLQSFHCWNNAALLIIKGGVLRQL